MSEHDDDRDLELLLGRAAPRPEPPDDVRSRVLDAVEREWRQQRRRRWRLPMALAASVLAALTVALVLMVPAPGSDVLIADTGGLWVDGVLYERGSTALRLPRDARLEARGSTRLLTDADVELRLREGTRLTWLEAGALDLARGAVYVDTGGQAGLRVHTPMGVVRDIGTTFMVTLDGDAMEVAMRDGEVAIDTDYGRYRARGRGRDGDVLKVGNQRILADVEPASAERWQWIHDVHPGYSERVVDRLLRAIAQDLGVGLEYASPAVAAMAQTLRLEGDLTGLGPGDALDVVLAATDLVREDASPQRLIIGIQSADQRQ